MKKLVMISIVFALGAGTAAGASTLFGPKGTFKAGILDDLSYSPEKACSKPSRPYSDDEYARDRYKSDGQNYLRCIQSAAESDISFAREVIQKGYTKAAEDFLREVKYGY